MNPFKPTKIVRPTEVPSADVTLKRHSNRSILAFAVLFAAYTIDGYITFIISTTQANIPTAAWNVVLLAHIVQILVSGSIWWIWAKDCKRLQNFFPILLAISYSLLIVATLLSGKFDSHSSRSSCNSYENYRALPPELLFGAAFAPAVALSLFPDTRWEVIALTWLIGAGTLMACCIQLRSRDLSISSSVLLLSSLLVVHTLLALRSRCTSSPQDYVSTSSETALAGELRAMIGNVAHDLKTVSAIARIHCS